VANGFAMVYRRPAGHMSAANAGSDRQAFLHEHIWQVVSGFDHPETAAVQAATSADIG
jgi:hypothetical protein